MKKRSSASAGHSALAMVREDDDLEVRRVTSVRFENNQVKDIDYEE